jgi:hypothetical protein
MAKLPFIVEPRLAPREELIGSESSGQIKVVRKGFLTAAEKAFVQAQVSEDTTTQDMVRLTRKIGSEHKLDMQAAYDLLTLVMQGELNSDVTRQISKQYSDEISDILTAMATLTERKSLVQALCLLIYRVDSEIGAEEIMEMHPDLLEGLSSLYVDEERRSTERLQQLIAEDGGAEGDASLIDALEKK